MVAYNLHKLKTGAMKCRLLNQTGRVFAQMLEIKLLTVRRSNFRPVSTTAFVCSDRYNLPTERLGRYFLVQAYAVFFLMVDCMISPCKLSSRWFPVRR